MTYPTSTIQSIEYYRTKEFKDSLIAQLGRIPSGLQLVPIRKGTKTDKTTGKILGLKAPLGDGWDKRLIDRSEIGYAIQSGEAWGIGLKLGVAGNGILAIDVDGLAAQAGLDVILAGAQLPKTVKFSSGKIGRSQLLFRVPLAQQKGLERKAQKFTNAAGDVEELDFRWSYTKIDKAGTEEITVFQSCLPATFHSLEHGVYTWVDGCSPDDTEIAELPQILMDYWLLLLNPVKSKVPTSKAKATHSKPSGKNNEAQFPSKLAKLVDTIKAAPNGSRNGAINKGVYSLAGQYPGKLDAIEAAILQVCEECGDDMENVKSILKSALPSGAAKLFTPDGGDSDQPQKLASLYAADLLVSEVLTNIEFDTHASQWYEYDGKGKWNPVMDARIFKLAKDYLRGVLPPFSLHYLNECITYARADVQVDGWNEADNLRYIPFTDGVLDLKANQFLEHSPNYRLTWQLPRARASETGDWSHIDRFLDTLANNDPELKKLAIAFCNAVLKGRSDLQRSLYLFGSGANGKGAYITLLEMLIGKENIHSTSMSELNTNRFEPANIRGKRLVMMPDEDKYGGGLNVFKAATGGNPVKFERKGENASTFLFQGMMVFAANKPTFLGNSDGGMGRRIVSFPCKSIIAPKDRRDMSPLFDADLTAFTSYLLSLDDAWVADTIHNADTIDAVKELATELSIRGDSVAAFYHAKLEPSIDGKNGCGSLYEVYREYCRDAGVSAKGLNNFTPDLMEYCNIRQGLAVTKAKGREGNYLLGIQVKRG